MTTTKEFLKEVKEQDLEERQVEVEAIGIGLNKFVDSMKSANLNRLKRSAILYKVIDAAGMTPNQLMADISKIKKEL